MSKTSLLSKLAAPFTFPFRKAQKDFSPIVGNLTEHGKIISKRYKGILINGPKKSTQPLTPIEQKNLDELEINMQAVKNRWLIYTSVYSFSMLSLLWGALNLSFWMTASSIVWMIFFWLHASRFAWAYHCTEVQINSLNDASGIRQKTQPYLPSYNSWMKSNWRNNLPLPPSAAH